MTKTHTKTFKFQNESEIVVERTINKLAPKTGFGSDGLSTKLITTIKSHIITPLTIIINEMLNTGIFPDKLKIAKIIPI